MGVEGVEGGWHVVGIQVQWLFQTQQLFLLTAAFFSLGSRASAPVQCWDVPYF